HQVLDYSRIETGRFEVQPVDVDLHSIVDPVAADHRVLAAEKGLRFSWENHCPGAQLRIDPSCLRGAVRNLLDNAVKFTDRGEVSVRVYRDAGGSVCLSVHDTGVGISDDYLEKLFEPFSQEETGYTRSFEGAGIGLSLARKYLELNGAELSAQSRKGAGSTFTIRFAPSAGNLAAGAPPAKRRASSAGRKPLVLLVEDDAQTQAYMKEALRPRFDVLVASSGRKARRHLAARGEDIGVILMDVSLQGDEDGLSLTRWLREQAEWSAVPVIATTAHASAEDRARALAAGCNDCLVKPFRHQELLAVIDRLC
ncbi:MAG: ATP-binding response regulator, partial [Candidatus Binatia bacterium]